jgi:hypothetical protein
MRMGNQRRGEAPGKCEACFASEIGFKDGGQVTSVLVIRLGLLRRLLRRHLASVDCSLLLGRRGGVGFVGSEVVAGGLLWHTELLGNRGDGWRNLPGLRGGSICALARLLLRPNVVAIRRQRLPLLVRLQMPPMEVERHHEREHVAGFRLRQVAHLRVDAGKSLACETFRVVLGVTLPASIAAVSSAAFIVASS